MPRYGQGDKVPFPTDEEVLESMASEREIVACSAVRDGPSIYMKVAFHSGDISMVSLSVDGAFRLLRVLKALVPDTPAVGEAHVIQVGGRPAVREGHMSGP